MFILIILFFIVFVVSDVLIIYKIKLLEDDIETLFDKYSSYIADSFSAAGGNKK